MYWCHFPPFTSTLSFRSASGSAAVTLALVLLAGLACDENAPTESRAPASRTQISSASDEPDLAAGEISTMSIALPVDQSVATISPAPAFRVRQTGTGPDGIFQIRNSSNTQTALQGLTNGRGRAGFFQITNTANTVAALQAQTNGSGSALSASTNGTGRAGLFEITNVNSVNPALEARSNSTSGFQHTTFYAVNTGTGSAGTFENNTNNGAVPAILGRTGNPSGTVALFDASHPNYSGTAVEVRLQGNSGVSGRGEGIRVDNQSGNGRAAIFITGNIFNPASTLLTLHTGNGYALQARGTNAALFEGNVTVTGTLTKPAGSFRIDHPLDPDHKTLSHSFVESPDMMNVYNGNVTLDAKGRGTVELPDYFEALNRDFRYQLTAIGAPGPNLYIAAGVNRTDSRSPAGDRMHGCPG